MVVHDLRQAAVGDLVAMLCRNVACPGRQLLQALVSSDERGRRVMRAKCQRCKRQRTLLLPPETV